MGKMLAIVQELSHWNHKSPLLYQGDESAKFCNSGSVL